MLLLLLLTRSCGGVAAKPITPLLLLSRDFCSPSAHHYSITPTHTDLHPSTQPLTLLLLLLLLTLTSSNNTLFSLTAHI